MAENAVERVALPTDPSGLPPMGDDFDAALESVITELGLTDTVAASAQARASYEMHARLLTAWGAAINLTAIREPAAIARLHVGDALAAVSTLSDRGAMTGSLLDVGSGGGYPGLPLAAALSVGRTALLDSVGKKARFLAVAGAAVTEMLRAADGTAPTIEAIAERAEDLADEAERREAWDIVTGRAVGPLSEVMELALPLTRLGGFVVAWKREGGNSDLRAELRDAGRIIRVTGGGRPDVVKIPGDTYASHRLIVVAKERPAAAGYPRAAGVRKRGQR